MFYLLVSCHDFTVLDLICVAAPPIRLVLSEPHSTKFLLEAMIYQDFSATFVFDKFISFLHCADLILLNEYITKGFNDNMKCLPSLYLL